MNPECFKHMILNLYIRTYLENTNQKLPAKDPNRRSTDCLRSSLSRKSFDSPLSSPFCFCTSSPFVPPPFFSNVRARHIYAKENCPPRSLCCRPVGVSFFFFFLQGRPTCFLQGSGAEPSLLSLDPVGCTKARSQPKRPRVTPGG